MRAGRKDQDNASSGNVAVVRGGEAAPTRAPFGDNPEDGGPSRGKGAGLVTATALANFWAAVGRGCVSIRPAIAELERIYTALAAPFGLKGKPAPVITIQRQGRSKDLGQHTPDAWCRWPTTDADATNDGDEPERIHEINKILCGSALGAKRMP